MQLFVFLYTAYLPSKLILCHYRVKMEWWMLERSINFIWPILKVWRMIWTVW
jgi:hypothetical protein